MLKYLQTQYGGKVDYAWSVGNEPDDWGDHVTGEQLAEDATTLKQLLTGFSLGSEVYGPSYAAIRDAAITEFLPVAEAGGVDGLTVHNYPYGKPCNVSKYLDKSPVTGHLAYALAGVSSIAESLNSTLLRVLEETAGSSGGVCVALRTALASESSSDTPY
jgi:hypothetical protein